MTQLRAKDFFNNVSVCLCMCVSSNFILSVDFPTNNVKVINGNIYEHYS